MASSLPLTTIPASTTHTHTVVFLHGRGDNIRNFQSSLQHSRTFNGQTLFSALPSFRWVFPQAPMRKCASSADTWPQWFDVWNVADFTEREELQADGLREVVPQIRDILKSEAAALGGRYDRIISMGISMGAATSIHTLINLDIPIDQGGKLAAFIGFSCRCPFPGRTLPEIRKVLRLDNSPNHDYVLRNTPILLEHCIDDPLVLVQNGRQLRDILRGYESQVFWREYPDGGHWFNSPAGMDDVIEFLRVHASPNTHMSSAQIPQSMDLS